MIGKYKCLAILCAMVFAHGCINKPNDETVSLNNTYYGSRLPEMIDSSIVAEYRIVNKAALGTIWFVYKIKLTENDTTAIMQLYKNNGADRFKEFKIEYNAVAALYIKTKNVIDNYILIRASLADRRFYEDGNILYIQGYSKDNLEMLTLKCDESLFNECLEISEIGKRLTEEFINKNDEIMKFLGGK